jgi:hypothetical protein
MSAKRRRYQTPRRRDRAEVVKAVAVSAGIVIATALMIWLLRPGPSSRFDGGGGGLFNRQPRASWLVGLTIASAAIFAWWVLTQRHRRSTPVLLVSGGLAIVAGAVLAGIFWPGGLLRQYETVPAFDPSEFEDLTSTTVPADTSSTVPADTSSTAPPGTDTAGAGSTTAPTAAPSETTPTTGSP